MREWFLLFLAHVFNAPPNIIYSIVYLNKFLPFAPPKASDQNEAPLLPPLPRTQPIFLDSQDPQECRKMLFLPEASTFKPSKIVPQSKLSLFVFNNGRQKHHSTIPPCTHHRTANLLSPFLNHNPISRSSFLPVKAPAFY